MIFSNWFDEALFLWYKGVMWLKRQRDTNELDWYEKLWGYPFVYAGVFIDIFYNVVIATVKYRDLPKELLFTSRLKRYKAGEDGWRKVAAEYICSILNKYDEGHC